MKNTKKAEKKVIKIKAPRKAVASKLKKEMHKENKKAKKSKVNAANNQPTENKIDKSMVEKAAKAASLEIMIKAISSDGPLISAKVISEIISKYVTALKEHPATLPVQAKKVVRSARPRVTSARQEPSAIAKVAASPSSMSISDNGQTDGVQPPV